MAHNDLSIEERQDRKALVETFLQQGYAPLRVRGGKGSATERTDSELDWASGTTARWVRDEERRREQGRVNFIPDWSLYNGVLPESLRAVMALLTPMGGEVTDYIPPKMIPVSGDPLFIVTDENGRHLGVEVDIPEDLDARARILRGEIVNLIQTSIYPVINPNAIVVDTTMTRRFDRKSGDYRDTVSTPRTWLSETLEVEPVKDPRNRKFIFTAAQNDCDVHEGFWENLQAYARHIGAEIAIGPLTYETTWWKENDPLARSYDAAIEPYLCFGQMAIGNNFVFCGEMNTLITASQPVTDLVTYPRNRWAVFPHGKRQLKSVPSTDPRVQAHQVMTTGMVTRPKIIPRKAGIKSLFHQVQGAVVVEFDEAANIFCRQLTANEDGSFYDLDLHVSGGKVTSGHAVTAVVFSDIHLRKLDAGNAAASFGFDPTGRLGHYRNSVLDVLKPKHILLHDVFDNESRNHHNAGDNAHSFEMAIRGRGSVGSEISDVGRFLERLAGGEREVIVVESNHDIGLERYVREGRYRNDGINIRLGLQLEDAYLAHRALVAEALDEGLSPPRFSLLEYAVRLSAGRGVDAVKWAYDGSSFLINGIEVGHHGFRGANGAKGTVQGFARVGRKMSIGDKHSPEIAEGVYVAGAMTLQQGYNKGPSSWAVSHIVHYPDGNRAIITLQNGRWRAEKPRVAMPATQAIA